MEANRRYTLMAFPQGFDGTALRLNIVLIPRNMDPFINFSTGLPAPVNMAQAFADFQPQFEAAIVKGLDEFPIGNAVPPGNAPVKKPLTVKPAASKRNVLKAVEKEFEGRITLTATDKAPEAMKSDEVKSSVKKYLPESYRNAFNFTTPRHENAKTDDSYHCAMRSEKKPVVSAPKMDVSWGQLYAHILRQPMLAKACGLIYETSITVDAGLLDKGGYIFINILNNDYKAIQDKSLEMAGGAFIKRYAARIPKLKVAEARPVFAPILFPVLHRKATDLTDPEPQNSPWDEIFAEVNEYNDGFAKIVHANQPVSGNLMAERQDGFHPQKDAGIRLGWDDEQILIWYIRQLMENPNEPGTKNRIDAPLGVFGYRIDVKDITGGEGDWESLNLVQSTQEYIIHGQSIGNMPDERVELPYQVYPVEIDGNTGKNYWLPMYYTNWMGRSLVMKDSDAAYVYQNEKSVVSKNDDTQKNVSLSKLFNEVLTSARLLYGNSYKFRIRLMDISGGGPKVQENELNPAAAPNTVVNFKRYIAPDVLRIMGVNRNEDPNVTEMIFLEQQKEFFNEITVSGNKTFDGAPLIKIQRPLLGYPAVVYTNKYQLAGFNPVQLLRQASEAMAGKHAFGIADPDVKKVEVTVEVETLRMDNMLSKSGQENYAMLYVTHRSFGNDFDMLKTLQVNFIDAGVVNLGGNNLPFGEAGANKTELDAMEEIVLPTARKIRITLRAVCEGNETYYGHINEGNKELDTRYGKTTQLFFYKESQNESELLLPKENVPPLQALYLQPDKPFVNNGNFYKILFKREVDVLQPDIVQRLASKLGVECKELTLVSKKGQRVVFGCSNRIRHTLAPNHSSITFASKSDLINHWIGLLTYKLNRDWSWNALEDVSFKIARRKKFHRDPDGDAEDLNYAVFKNESNYAGDIEIKHTVPFEALQPDNFDIINRDHTTLIFIDAIEPKSGLPKSNTNPETRFPDEVDIDYKLIPFFKQNHARAEDREAVSAEPLQLPTTVNPVQVPKLISVGIAFSPYLRNERYSYSEARRRYLWVEIEEPVKDPNDTLFCRVLAYAPDQLISNNHPELVITPEEPPLPVDPEFIRMITPGQSDDMAGLSAMQPMEKATDSDVHYLLPLPPGMHAESAELFGFFTYEFRIGHGHWNDRPENLWSTAQGRFGRPLRVTGMQHPAPTLLCSVNRNEKILYVNAPYAQAVHNGKNVTSEPPRTELWCLLYAQVSQADGKDFRNILLDEKRMDWRKRLFAGVLEQNVFINQYSAGISIIPPVSSSVSFVLDDVKIAAGAKKAIIKDQPRTGLAMWENKEIEGILLLLGLPVDLPLSVLVVEVFGNITSLREHITDLQSADVRTNVSNVFRRQNPGNENERRIMDEMNRAATIQTTMMATQDNQRRPLSNELGQFRILRTSPLTEVPFVCCTD